MSCQGSGWYFLPQLGENCWRTAGGSLSEECSEHTQLEIMHTRITAVI